MKTLQQKIGFLGCGNMGAGILSGLLRNRIMKKDQIFIFDIDSVKQKKVCRQFRVRGVHGVPELLHNASLILFAVKPQDLATVGKEVREHLRPAHRVITILAGVPIEKIQRELGDGTRVVRAMPNLAATVGQAVTAITGERRVDLDLAEVIFSGCGKVIRLPEKFFNLVTALSGSGPAYFFYLIEHLIQAGVRFGLSEEEAALLAVQTARGAAELVLTSTQSPSALRQMVTSKGGTTEAALATLEEKGFPGIFASAIENAVRRAEELGKG